ncbi:MAG: hypothetical protein AAFO62_12110 [Pseudomonadota bacterium]
MTHTYWSTICTIDGVAIPDNRPRFHQKDRDSVCEKQGLVGRQRDGITLDFHQTHAIETKC